MESGEGPPRPAESDQHGASGPYASATPPPPYPPPYGQPPAPYPYPQSQVNGFAIASLVLGIIWIYWVGSILALVFGYIAKRQIAQSGGRQSGRGMAIAGIVLGWVGIGVLVLVALFVLLVSLGAT